MRAESRGHARIVGARHQRQHAEIGQRLHGATGRTEFGQVFDLDARAALAHQHEVEFADQPRKVQQLVQGAAQGGAVEADVGDAGEMREPLRHVEVEDGALRRQLLGIGRHAPVPLGIDAAPGSSSCAGVMPVWRKKSAGSWPSACKARAHCCAIRFETVRVSGLCKAVSCLL
jgi:hypothetical protein